MTLTRSLAMAVPAVFLLIGARPIALDEQFPRGLLAGWPGERAQKFCTIETRPLSFGTYDPLDDAPREAVGQIIYLCGNGNEVAERDPVKNIRIEMARGWSNAYSVRLMAGPDYQGLEYNIYLDATHRTIWGDGTSGTDELFRGEAAERNTDNRAGFRTHPSTAAGRGGPIC